MIHSDEEIKTLYTAEALFERQLRHLSNRNPLDRFDVVCSVSRWGAIMAASLSQIVT